MPANSSYVLALDVGEKRTGVALASLVARLASPLTTLEQGPNIWTDLAKIIKTETVGLIVVGLPRSLDGLDTDQTRYVRDFAAQLEKQVGLPIVFQDEALTSRQAEAELRASGKKFAKSDIDALAAVYILEDYLSNSKVA